MQNRIKYLLQIDIVFAVKAIQIVYVKFGVENEGISSFQVIHDIGIQLY